MIRANRKECRKRLAELIENKLTVENSFAKEVHAESVKMFTETPAVVVTSDGSRRTQLTFQGLADAYYFLIETFITFPTQDDTTYTRETVEDSLDNIEAGIAEVISENNKESGYWEHLAFADRSDTINVPGLDGTQYRFERILIEVT